MRFMRRLLLGVVVLVPAWWTAAADAGLTYVSQTRRVEADTERPGDDEPGSDNGALRTAGTDDLGRFTADVRSSYTAPRTLDGAITRVSHDSTIDGKGVRASGTVLALDEPARYLSLVSATFDVAAPTPYTLTAGLRLPNFTQFQGSDELDPELYVLRLQRVGAGVAPLVEERWFNYDMIQDRPNTDVAGTLSPGRYNLLLDIGTTTVTGGTTDGSYYLNFTVGKGDGPPSAVPLPPMVWGGAASLAGIAGAQVWRRRRAQVE